MRCKGKKLAQVARLWARGQLQFSDPGQSSEHDDEFDEALAAMGFFRSEADEADAAAPQEPEGYCYLWPCNLRVWMLWNRLQTQWCTGFQGRTGLDYASVIAYLRDVARVKRRDWDETFAGIQAMERAALDTWDDMRD